MIIAAIPDNETLRIENLLSYDILDTADEKDFDELTALAADICQCAYALITFVDTDRQWFKAKKLLKEKETSRDVSFCAHAILKQEVMIVYDAQKDERFFDNPLVTGDPFIAFYAGAPIISEAGFALGTVCVFDQQAKNLFTPGQQQALKTIAGQVSKLLELKAKNKLMIERSNLLIEAEKKIARLTLISHDKEKSIIANELHENFAQTLAGIKLYIEFAQQSQDQAGHFLQKSKEQISNLIKEVRVLTKSIVPTTLENDNYIDIINELTVQFSKRNNINIQLMFGQNFGAFDKNIGFTMFRIIENQLKISLSAGAKNIVIEIKKGKEMSILFTDDGNTKEVSFDENDLLRNDTVTRTGILKGKLEPRKKTGSKNIVAIKIPLVVA